MFEMVWKDVVAARWVLVFLIPFYAVWLAANISLVPMFWLATLLFTAILGFGSIGLEEKQGTEPLWCSLPVTRRDVVLARYLSTVLGLLVGLAMSLLIGRSLSGIAFLAGGPNSAPAFGLEVYAALSVLLILFAAAFLPCYFRYGAGKGLVVFSALAAGALIVISLLAQVALFLAGYSGPLPDAESWRNAAAAIGPEERKRLTRLAIGGMSLLSAVAFVLSAGLSVHFYQNRDL
jgi:ABC-2 type transport system permease protein